MDLLSVHITPLTKGFLVIFTTKNTEAPFSANNYRTDVERFTVSGKTELGALLKEKL